MNNQSSGLKDNAVYLQSLGAAETVTGSKHLLKTPGLNILMDCGLFQGIKSLREKNWQPLPVDPASIDVVILTHAHLDHCGYIPLLVKNGYQGKIYMSSPTRDLAELILRESAKLQEEDAQKAYKHGYTKHNPTKPLYDTADVEAALPQFKTIDPGEIYRLSENIQFQFYKAGHIPGACSVAVNCYEKTIVFSGDIGRYHSLMLPPPHHIPEADFVVMESTYGDRLHETYNIAQHLAFIINGAISHGGNVLIPCFAAGRAQEIMYMLYELKKSNSIPAGVPVYLDSPVAASVGKALLKYPDWITINENEVSQIFSEVNINQDDDGARTIIRRKGSKIILAASGMLTGGRVLEYLKHYITDHRNTVLIVGYQAEGTRGRALLNHNYEIKIHGQYYNARARVEEISSLSAHADQAELIKWLEEFKGIPPQIYLVHGEPSAQEALRVKIKDKLHFKVTILKQDQNEFLFAVNQRNDIIF